MKKTFYLSLCALLVIALSSKRAGATGAIASHMDGAFCASPLDSVIISETGYATGDSMIIDYGDGTTDTAGFLYVVAGTGWFSQAHIYSSTGTYTRKIVLLSGGVRVDSVTYSYTWRPCKYMSVRLYNDVNSDCILDAGDSYFIFNPATVEVDSAGVPVDTATVTCWIGYEAFGPSGTVYTFKVIDNPHGFLPSCPSTGLVNITVGSATYYEDSIGFKCDTSACTDNALIASISAGISGAWSSMIVSSTSCTPVSTTVDFTFSPKYSVATVYGASSYSISGNTITITVPAVSATTVAYLNILFSPVGTLSIGDTVNSSWRLNPFSGDCDTTNNIVTSVDTIRASFDPNHKSVQPQGDITAGTNLKYTISFENTGNAPAQNIHVMDTLSDNLDVTTIKQTGSSSSAEMSLLTYAGHNIVKFDFPNINLPDSSHHPINQGFVEFSINAKSTLSPGTVIDNKAGIYFDVNPVVMTNGVESKIRTSTTGVTRLNMGPVEVYPNPANNTLTVKTGNVTYNTLTITNTLGQVLINQPVSNATSNVNVGILPAGVYYITLKGASGVAVQKFEKL